MLARPLVIAFVSLFVLVSHASSSESSDQLGHAIYVAFQAPQHFTDTEIEKARQHIIASANEGDKLAQRIVAKLESKLTTEALAAR